MFLIGPTKFFAQKQRILMKSFFLYKIIHHRLLFEGKRLTEWTVLFVTLDVSLNVEKLLQDWLPFASNDYNCTKRNKFYRKIRNERTFSSVDWRWFVSAWIFCSMNFVSKIESVFFLFIFEDYIRICILFS